MLSLLSFILVVVVVVSIHEYGHYLAARWFKVRVIRFSVGLGKPLWSYFDKHNTQWVIAPIPLGGYVQMLDEQTAALHGIDRHECIESKPAWQKIIVYAAGPFANLLLSVVLLTAVLGQGVVGLKPEIGTVFDDSPAQQAGLAAGQTIRQINDNDIVLWQDVEAALVDSYLNNQPINLETSAGNRHAINATLGMADIKQGISRVIGIAPRRDFILPKIQQASGAAAQSGLLAGDEFLQIGNKIIDTWDEVLYQIQRHPAQTLSIIVWRGDAAVTVTAQLESTTVEGRVIGRLGVAPVVDRDKLPPLLLTLHLSPLEMLQKGVGQTFHLTQRTLQFLGKIFQTGQVGENLSGPVGIAAESGKAAGRGVTAWLQFVAFISVSLAVLNLLPLPILDGGQIVLCVLESVFRKKLPEKWLAVWQGLGVLLLLALFAYVIVNDVVRLFS